MNRTRAIQRGSILPWDILSSLLLEVLEPDVAKATMLATRMRTTRVILSFLVAMLQGQKEAGEVNLIICFIYLVDPIYYY